MVNRTFLKFLGLKQNNKNEILSFLKFWENFFLSVLKVDKKNWSKLNTFLKHLKIGKKNCFDL